MNGKSVADANTNDLRLTAQGLTRYYGQYRAVDQVDITLARGEILGLLGPNGAGKTTTLRMLAGALAPSAGTIRITGHDLARAPIAAKRHIGYLPERPPVYPELTVDEYLRFCARLHGIGRRARGDAIASAKADCGLEDTGKRLIGNLSKGYQQRVGIAQAIAHRPDVVILDEPTAGLDPNQIRQIRALIARLAVQHSVIISSHILPEIQAVASRVMLIHRGRVALDAPMAELAAGGPPSRVRLHLTNAPEAVELTANLTAIDGVEAAEHLADGEWRITAARGVDVRPQLATLAVQNGWGLVELAGEHRTLEELFTELTTHDKRAAEAA